MKRYLSNRLRPNSEAAPWVLEEVKQLEKELDEAYAELSKQQPAITAVYDRSVWARVAAWYKEKYGVEVGEPREPGKFVIGDTVTWSSQSQGYRKTKTGMVVYVLPEDCSFPDSMAWRLRGIPGMRRNHESYIVEVGTKLYWPLVSKLKLVTP